MFVGSHHKKKFLEDESLLFFQRSNDRDTSLSVNEKRSETKKWSNYAS